MPLHMDDIEIVKENLLPLRQGRRVNALKAALCNDGSRFQRVKLFEQELHTYSGDDPLSVWYSYIQFVEQHFITGGREGNIRQIVQKCLIAMKDIKKYNNDQRFWKVWRRFAEASDRPSEIYSYMYSNKFCCGIAEFFIVWSMYVESHGNIKGADEILENGINCFAQPISALQTARKRLEARLARTIQESSNSSPEANSTEERSAFTELIPVGKRNMAPISRVGESTYRGTNRAHILNSFQQQQSRNTVLQELPFKIYNSENEVSTMPLPSENSAPYMISSSIHKENKQKPSKWTKVKKTHSSVPQTAAPKPLSFTIYQDEVSDNPEPIQSRKSPQNFNVLSTKNHPSPPTALFEPPDPMIRPMYDKMKVYYGAEEFSFEELRALTWYKNQRKMEEDEKNNFTEKHLADIQQQVNLLQEKLQHSTIKNVSDEMKRHEKQNSPIVFYDENKYQVDKASEDNCTDGTGKKDANDTNDVEVSPAVPVASVLCSYSQESTITNLNKRNISQYQNCSPTTKAVFDMVQGWYCDSSSANQENEVSIPHELCEMAALPPADKFSIYCDPECNETETKRPCGFHIYCDPEEDKGDEKSVEFCLQSYNPGVNMGKNLPLCPKGDKMARDTPDFSFCFDTKFESLVSKKNPNINICPGPERNIPLYPTPDEVVFQHPENLEEVENMLPAYAIKNIYGQPGVLQPLSCVPREVPLLEFYPSEEEKHTLGTRSDDTTMVPPANTEQFAIHAFSASTPCTKKSTLALHDSCITQFNDCQHLYTVGNEPDIHCSNLDPFDPMITQSFLNKMNFPASEVNFFKSTGPMKNIKPGMEISLGEQQYIILNLLGKGRFAKVYKAEVVENICDGNLKSSPVVLKVCRHQNEWEFYICAELQKRLLDSQCDLDVTDSIMKCISAVSYDDGIIMLSDISENGSLVDLINLYKSRSVNVPESLVMYLTFELLGIMSQIHKCGIIHGDVKPDNFVINGIPSYQDITNNSWERTLCLRLIDFGRGIDLHCFEKGTAFKKCAKPFACVEMQEGRPWIFQGDWFGIAGTIHAMLFSEYMKLEKTKDSVWRPVMKIKRYWQTDLWIPLFHMLLNLPLSKEPPDVRPFMELIISKLKHHFKDLSFQLNQLSLTYAAQ